MNIRKASSAISNFDDLYSFGVLLIVLFGLIGGFVLYGAFLQLSCK